MKIWLDAHTSRSSARFIVWRAPSLRDLESFGAWHGPLVLEVCLVPTYDDWHVLVVLDANDLIAESR